MRHFVLSALFFLSLCAGFAQATSLPMTQCAIDKEVTASGTHYDQCPVGSSDGFLLDQGYNAARLEPSVSLSKTPIYAHGTCAYVDANGINNALFIPFNTKEEWEAFLQNTPSGVRKAQCCLSRTMKVSDIPVPTEACAGNVWVFEALVNPADHTKILATPASNALNAILVLANGVSENVNYPITALPISRDDIGALTPFNSSYASAYTARWFCNSSRVPVGLGSVPKCEISACGKTAYVEFRLQCREGDWRHEEECTTHVQEKTETCQEAGYGADYEGSVQVRLTTRQCGDAVYVPTREVLSDTCKPKVTCTPEVLETFTEACANNLDGEVTKRKVRTCPSGEIKVETVSSTCQCVKSRDLGTVDKACPAGKTGKITYRRIKECFGRQPVGTGRSAGSDPIVSTTPDTGSDIITHQDGGSAATSKYGQYCFCSTREEKVSEDCHDACVPSEKKTEAACPAGQTGKIVTTTRHICDGSNDGAGRDEVSTDNQCVNVCTPGPVGGTYTEACPAGQTGIITKRKVRICPQGTLVEEVVSNTCRTSCVPSESCSRQDCPAGQEGYVQVTTRHICDGSNGGAGRDVVDLHSFCRPVCHPWTRVENRACPAGYTGTIEIRHQFLCDCADGREVITEVSHCTRYTPPTDSSTGGNDGWTDDTDTDTDAQCDDSDSDADSDADNGDNGDNGSEGDCGDNGDGDGDGGDGGE